MLTSAQRRQLKAMPLTRVEQIPNRLRAAMDLARVTQAHLAKRTGLTQPYISKIENGLYSELPRETMRALASAFDCSAEDLFPAREVVAS